MRCAACNKESTNRRVCPYCFTPYPADAAGTTAGPAGRRASTAGMPAVGAEPAGPLAAIRAAVMRQSPTVRWSGLGILVVGLLWLLTGGEPAGAPPPAMVAASGQAVPMGRDEAIALVTRTRESALVETQAGEVWVSYPAADFPVLPEGRALLAIRFARADEIVEGRKRRIRFYDPNGRLFAQADPVTGVSTVK